MASSSVSFRITRTAEDLAGTIHALSQRLISMEQRLAALESQLEGQDQTDHAEVQRLENVERLLRDCRDLLESESEGSSSATPSIAAGSIAPEAPQGFSATAAPDATNDPEEGELSLAA